ncbi:MAG: pyrroline-5-carboxylate reductase [Gammaproteobacteria bacterium]|nr:pyrroline-5-carboxylate reductase [Gammaproteobacteria bacterium]MDH5593808.1 pyrroline-5-carboxylate reductase [Gammaproteobacteria bacterium]
MKNSTIAFIGGGNMASSLIGGLIADGCPPGNLWVTDLNQGKLDYLANRFSINTTPDNNKAVTNADVVVLCVKPQVMHEVIVGITDSIQTRKPLVISVAAGIREKDLQTWLGGNVAIVRVMPNTPALIQTGASGLFANTYVSEEQCNLAESILRAVGLALWLDDEAMMDIVTALSGSGPAYFFYVMEAMEKAATTLGMEQKTARLLTLQTALGAAKMALESAEDIAELRQRVTSPGGTTEQAINTLQSGGLETLFADALTAAANRSKELAKEFGEK